MFFLAISSSVCKGHLLPFNIETGRQTDKQTDMQTVACNYSSGQIQWIHHQVLVLCKQTIGTTTTSNSTISNLFLFFIYIILPIANYSLHCVFPSVFFLFFSFLFFLFRIPFHFHFHFIC